MVQQIVTCFCRLAHTGIALLILPRNEKDWHERRSAQGRRFVAHCMLNARSLIDHKFGVLGLTDTFDAFNALAINMRL